VGTTPDFLGEWLPGIVLLGLGAGVFFPNLSAAAVASAPGERFATATALNAVARQVGAALGVAVVVAVIGRPSPLQAHAAFDDAWTFGACCMFVAGLGCLLVGRVGEDSPRGIGDAIATRARAGRGRARGAELTRARRAMRTDATAPPGHRAETAADFLGRVPLFAELAAPLRDSLAGRVHALRVDAGDWLFRAGDPGEAMYVVRTGRLHVVDEANGEVIRELGRGDALGELALLSDAPRSASVRAARASEVLAIDRADFEELASTDMSLSLSLNGVLAAQLRENRAPAATTRPLPATVAVVGLDERVPVADLARRLTHALREHVDSALLDGGEHSVNGTGEAAGVFAPFLDAAEAEHDVVVLDAGLLSDGGNWSEFCLRQADRILAVGTGARKAPPSALDELRGCDLVAYDVAPGSGSLAPVVAALDPVEHHALRPAELDADVARIARRLSGRSIGLVLSGGGARALAHIGVIEELVAAGVTIDRVAGVSMGAFVGGLFAMGLSAEEIDACCFEELVQRRPLGDFTIPRRSLIRGARAEAMLERAFADVAIEELPLGFVCACADLRSARLVMMSSGLLRDQIACSICVPVLGTPRVRGRQLLVDGSLLDNLPVKQIADFGEGPLIAVDVKATFDDGGSSKRARAGHAGGERAPSLGETLTRVLLIGSSNTSEEARRHADVVIKPRPDGVGLLEFHQIDAARAAGSAAAREALAAGLADGLG
jgi:NTE family protein